MLLKSHETGKIDLKIGRAADFYGPRVKQSGIGSDFFKSIEMGKATNVVGNIDKKHSITYIKDFARVLVTLGNNENASEIIYHVPNMEVTSVRNFGKAIASTQYRSSNHA